MRWIYDKQLSLNSLILKLVKKVAVSSFVYWLLDLNFDHRAPDQQEAELIKNLFLLMGYELN